MMHHLFLLLSLLLLLLAPTAHAQEATPTATSRAALVVAFADGRSETACVAFAEADISGYELLQRSGLPLVVNASGAGTAVCRIADTGCPAEDCFCECQGADCEYWSYWRLTDTGWAYAQAGAHLARVRDGDVQGWTWGPGSVTAATAPPALRFADVCTAETVAAPAAPAEQPAAPVNLLAYAPFALILLALGGLLLWQRRRGENHEPG